MIQLCDISLGYEGDHLLQNVNATFDNSCLTALVGRNGSGKSTLLRAIASLDHFTSGSALLDGKDSASIQPVERAQSIAFVSTERVRIPNLLCRDLVALGRAPYTNWFGKMQKEDEDIVMHSLELVGMVDYALRSMDKMSDGECQRVMIARALAQNTSNIILDEPTSFLDIPNRHDLCMLLSDLAHSQGKCILFSTHEIDIALNMCDSIALIDSRSLIHLPVEDFKSQNLLHSIFHI